MLVGCVDGLVNGIGVGNLVIGEIVQLGLFKIFVINFSNVKYVFDEFLVFKDSLVKLIVDFKGKKVVFGFGIQNVILVKMVFECVGVIGVIVVELFIGQYVVLLVVGQVDVVYMLELIGIVGCMNNIICVLEVGVIVKYILGDLMVFWYGGVVVLIFEFIKKNLELVCKYIVVYVCGIELVCNNLDQVCIYLKGYIVIEGLFINEVLLVVYMFYNEFKFSDLVYFQKFYDLFVEKGVFL